MIFVRTFTFHKALWKCSEFSTQTVPIWVRMPLAGSVSFVRHRKKKKNIPNKWVHCFAPPANSTTTYINPGLTYAATHTARAHTHNSAVDCFLRGSVPNHRQKWHSSAEHRTVGPDEWNSNYGNATNDVHCVADATRQLNARTSHTQPNTYIDNQNSCCGKIERREQQKE